MTKFRWNESMNVFSNHIDPEKEEQLKSITIETDTKVTRILKLVKSINSGNKDAKQRKRTEVIQLIEDFHKQYQSMYALYDDLKEGVKKKCNNEEDKEDMESSISSSSSSSSSPSPSASSPSMESITLYSPATGIALDSESKTPNCDQYEQNESKPESSSYSYEDTSEVVKEALSVEPVSSSYKAEETDEDNDRTLENSVFQSRVSELEYDFLTKVDECEKNFASKIDKSMFRVQNLQTEVNSLRSQNKESQKNFTYEKEKELESLRTQNTESEIELEKKTKEVADSLKMLESLTEKLKQKTINEEGLVEERNSLKKRVKDLEEEISNINNETRLSKSENIKQRAKVSQLEENLHEKEVQIFTLKSNIDGVKKDMTIEMKILEKKCKSLEIDKRELERKADALSKTLEQREKLVNKLNRDAKSSFRTTERKMEEMVEEFRKKSEDSIRLLSRRIRVAEQLHNENKEWYKKAKEQQEEEQRQAFRNIKLITETVSDTLSVSEALGLRFVECCEHFMNRVSKAACEINFFKDWARRKNASMAQLREDFDTLLVQLDDKEEEILGSRQKVWKLENKVRELEKMVKENDETMIVLKEEKREAIRQLCVWIDYHRSRFDYLKKAFSDFIARSRRG